MRARLLVLALVAAAGATTAAAAPAEKRFGDWTVGAMPDDSGAYAATINDSKGLIGLYCYRDTEKCIWILANDIKCEDGSKYPVLGNSDVGAFSTVIVCMKLGDRPRYAFADYDEIEDAVLKADWLGIAFPLASGKFTVSRFSLKGSNEAVAFLHKVMGAAVERTQGTKDQSL